MSDWFMITFPAWQGKRYIGLAEILVRFGNLALELEWSCTIDETAPEPRGPELESLTPDIRLPTLDLLALVAPDVQVIDGQFNGYRYGTNDPTVRIRAVDSTAWDIETRNLDVLQQLVAAYQGARRPIQPQDRGFKD